MGFSVKQSEVMDRIREHHRSSSRNVNISTTLPSIKTSMKLNEESIKEMML